MTFPDTALDVVVELQLGTAWTNIIKYVFTRDPITITRGRQDEGSQPDPTQCTLTLNNRDGRFSPRNPLGPYYGVLGRNTPLRVRVGVPNRMALQVPDTAGSSAGTPDNAAIDITGDLDVRVDADVQWVGDSGGLIGKYVETGNQRSWILWSNGDGKLTLYWSTDGGNLPSAVSTAAVPVTSGRLAVRATLDVNNGASGRTVTFYTAPTNAGPWTQLGAPVVQAGTTSVFNSTSPLQVGEALSRIAGDYYAAEVRNGIGGTVAANPNFNGQAKGTTGFTDGAGRVWTVNGDAAISDWVTRFYGEVPSWPIRWDTSGKNVWVQIEASGISRRLAQGAKPLRSALYRALSGAPQKITAYWPLEDGAGATRAASALSGGSPLKVSGQVTFTDEPAGGTAGGATFGDGGRLTGVTPAVGGTGEWMVYFWLDIPADMGGADVQGPYVQWWTPGSKAARFYCYTSQALGGKLVVEVADSNNTNLTTIGGTTDLRGKGPQQVVILGYKDGTAHGIQLALNGQNLEAIDSIASDAPTTPTAIGVNLDIATTGLTFSGTVSHMLVAPLSSWLQNLGTDQVGAGQGYVGETASARVLRLCREEGIPATTAGASSDGEPMGVQTPVELLTLLAECADADGGTLAEQRGALGFAYRARVADYNSPAAVTLDYTSQVAAPLEPVDDDQQTRNDVTVQRTGGSSARVTLDVGTLSTQPPPYGVGVYNEEVTLNLATDDQLLDQAGWRVHLGTVDEARYPVVRVKLHKHPELIDQVVAMDLRSRIHLTGLPAWEPPGTVDLIADGYTETIELHRWTIEFNTVPGSPWRVAVTNDPVLARVETDGSQLAAGATAAATGLNVASTGGAYWTTDPAQVPFDVTVGGEIVTATAIGDAVNDSFARTVASGWGTSPDGRTWTVDGTASNYSVASGQAAMSFAAANTGLFGYLDLTSPALDVEGTFRTLVAPLTGGGLYGYLLGHVQPGGTGWYALRARLGVDGGVYLALETGPPSFTALTGEEQVAGLTVTANAWLRARLRIQAGTIAAKLWPDGTAEPLEWALTATDTTLTSGMPGLRAFLIGGNTNTKPFVVQFGELIVHNPQLMTVTRGTNGITKPLAAGTAVNLTQTPTIAL